MYCFHPFGMQSNISVYYNSESIFVVKRFGTMKNVILKTPYNKEFIISGSDRDKSIIGAIESNRGLYEQNNLKLLKRIIKPDSICLDIGANIGVISLSLSYLATQGRVISFEPSNYNYTFLLRNILQNNVFNILPLNYGLLDTECTIDFSYVEEVAGCSFISDTGVKEGVAETIKCISLDTWVDIVGLEHIDFIKMDVEGAEIKALNGGIKTIKKVSPDLMIEFNPVPLKRFFNENPSNLFDWLHNHYERIYLISEGLTEIKDYDQIEQILQKGKGWEDLYCTSKHLKKI